MCIAIKTHIAIRLRTIQQLELQKKRIFVIVNMKKIYE